MKLSFPIIALFSTAFGLPNLQVRQCTTALTDDYIFDISLANFEAKRAALSPSCFDWSSNNCSDSPDKPLGFPFAPACQRHDFGYRNYKAQGRFTEDNCQKINSNLLSDLDVICAQYSWLEKDTCDEVAKVYYEAVKVFGCDS